MVQHQKSTAPRVDYRGLAENLAGVAGIVEKKTSAYVSSSYLAEKKAEWTPKIERRLKLRKDISPDALLKVVKDVLHAEFAIPEPEYTKDTDKAIEKLKPKIAEISERYSKKQ